LIRTIDGGKHWSSAEIETQRDLYDASFEDQRGIIVGDGVALASNDGGSNWRPLILNGQQQWFTGVALKSSEAIAVGPGGGIQVLALDKVVSPKESRTR